MPFDLTYLSIERGQPNSFISSLVPAMHRYYSATDASTDALVSGYFDAALPPSNTLTGTAPPFRVNDLIVSNLTDGLFNLRITQVSPTITTGIENADISDGSITFAKIQSIATDSILGRDSAGTGSTEALTVSGGLELTGSGGIQRSAVGGDITIAAGSNTAAITAGAIVNADISDLAHIAYSKMAAMPAGKILVGNGSDTPTLMDMSQDVHINFAGATTIQPKVVTYSKIQDVSESALLGRGQGIGSGAPQELTLGSGLTLTGTTLSASGSVQALPNGQIFVGDITNLPAPVPMTGPVNIDNTGLTSIQNASITKSMLSAGINPVAIIAVRATGQTATPGGVLVSVSDSNINNGDTGYVNIRSASNSAYIRTTACATGSITFIFNTDPGSITFDYYTVRTAS